MAGKRHVDRNTDKAIKTNNWDKAKAAANKDLTKANAKLLNDEKQRSRQQEQLDARGLPREKPDYPIEVKVSAQEYLTEHLEEDLDELDQEDAPDLGLGDPENQAPNETLRDVYSDYRNSGGNRSLEERVLKWFDPFEITEIDVKAKRRCAATFYPDLHSQDEEVLYPIAEVLRWWKKEDENVREAKTRWATGLTRCRQTHPWAAEQPKGPHPFAVKHAWEIKHPPRPSLDDTEKGWDGPRDSWAAAIRKVELLANRRPAHNAPLPKEIQKHTTQTDWDRYQLRQLASVCVRHGSEFGMSPRLPLKKFYLPSDCLGHGCSTRIQVREEGKGVMEAFLADSGAVTICPPYYGYGAGDKRKRGRPPSNVIQLPARPAGRPRLGEEPLTNAECSRRKREKKKRLNAATTVAQFTPRLQAWMRNNLKPETLSIFNLRKAA